MSMKSDKRSAKSLFASISDENTGGNCFEQAFQNQQEDRSLLVCHGVVHGQGPLEGYVFSHAWNETADGMFVVDTSNGNDLTLPRDLYYSVGRIDPDGVRRYTADDVLDEVLSLGHYGPWDPELNFEYRAAFSTAVDTIDDSVVAECSSCGKLMEVDASTGLCRCCGDLAMFSDLAAGNDMSRYGFDRVASMVSEMEVRPQEDCDLLVWNGHRAMVDKSAAWEDVKRKGEAIVAAGGVEIVRNDAVETVALVMSGELDTNERFDVTDGGPYEVTLSKKSWENKDNVGGWVQSFFCTCEWGQYHSGSVGDGWEGRLCSHAYAALLASGQRARKDMMNDRRAASRRKADWSGNMSITWEQEVDENGLMWWFANVWHADTQLDLSVVEAYGGAWDSYQWEVWETSDDGGPVAGGSESTLEQAMEEAEAVATDAVRWQPLENFGSRKRAGGGRFPRFDQFEYSEDVFGDPRYAYQSEDYEIIIGWNMHGIMDGHWDWEVSRANTCSDLLLQSWTGCDTAEGAYEDLRQVVFHEKDEPRSDLWFDDMADMDIVFGRRASRRKRADHGALKDDIIDFLRRNDLCGDERIYCDGKAWDVDYDGSVSYVGDLDPRDCFEYVREPNILSMSFEGPLYLVMNCYWENPLWLDLFNEFSDMGSKYGLYWEQGDAWNLTFYEINDIWAS